MKKSILKRIHWEKIGGLVPAIIQNDATNEVIMLGYMSKESLEKTWQTKKIWFYSRSKKRLWMKGESSGNVLELKKISLDCDSDALLIRVKPKGQTCHTGKSSCFDVFGISELYQLIEKRKNELKNANAQRFSSSEQSRKTLPMRASSRTQKKEMPDGSYTIQLLKAGLPKICDKILEEAREIIFAAKKESKKRLIEESADVLYHLFVLLVSKNITLKHITKELERRSKK